MAKKSSDGKNPIKLHPLVEETGIEPRRPDLVSLRGYVGPAEHVGFVRIYHGLDFSGYTEVPEDAIRQFEVTDSNQENRPAKILIPTDTEVRRVQGTEQAGEAAFLSGGAATGLTGDSGLQAQCNDTLNPPPQTDCCPDTVDGDVKTVPPKCPAPPPKKPKSPKSYEVGSRYR